MNHALLFAYVLLLAAGTGGVVSLAFLHHRLRQRITVSFLVANTALLISLIIVLVSFYLDQIIVASPGEDMFELSLFRTLAGFILGAITYGGVASGTISIPGVTVRRIIPFFVVPVAGMLVQSVLVVGGFPEIARSLGPVYLYTVSVCLFAIGTTLIRRGPNVEYKTMAWFLVGYGYLTAFYAVGSVIVYSLLSKVSLFARTEVSLDFVYYFLWSLLSILAFLRYLTRPSALRPDDHVSDAFVTAYGITPREREIIVLIGRGLSNQQIADRLNVSFTTVRTHVYNCFQKCGAGSRVDLLRLVSGFTE